MRPDHIVIGSGLAGLTFAALAARAGRHVVVLEAHEHAGGYGHTFELGKAGETYRFNAQLHYVWNCGPGQTVNRVLDKLGLAESVPFERLDPNGHDRMRMPGHALDVPGSWEELQARLARLFPADAARCTAFVAELKAFVEEVDALPSKPTALRMLPRLHRYRRVIRYRNATVGQVFERFGLPPAARTLLALQWPDFLLPPGQLSFIAWALLFAGYVRGAYYPRHHFESVVDGMVRVIRESGGEVRLCRRVRELIFGGDRVVGVVAEVVDTLGTPTGAIEEVRGPSVICNADPRRVAEKIGLERFSPAVRRQLSYDYSPSNFMIYGVYEGDLREHGFGRSNLFHTDEPDLDAAFRAMYQDGDYSRPSFAMTVPSLLTEDRSDCPEGKQIVELLTVADYDRFLALKLGSPGAYRRKKQEIADALFAAVEREYVPDFRERLCFHATGSPTTNQRFALSPAGNSYGSSLTPANMGPGRLTAHSSIPGLHFCNGSSGYPGFAPTIWTGASLYGDLTGDPVV